MHVALLNYESPPYCGGGGVFTADLNDALTSAGLETTTITGERQSSEATVAELVSFPLTSAPKVTRAVRDGVDVLNGHFSLPTSLALPALKQLHDVPLVVNVMGADVFDPTRYGAVRPLLDAVNNHWVLKHADAVVAPSSDLFDRLPRRIRNKTEIIPYFVDVDRFHPRDKQHTSGTLRLLSVSRLVDRKNLRTALLAADELHSRGVDVEMTVAGSGSGREGLERLASRLDVGVDFVGYVSEDDLPGLYNAHDIFVLPSHHEAFGIVYLEALACGLPVVASNVGGQTDIINDDVGRTVDGDNRLKIADAVADLWSDYEYHASNARGHVENTYTATEVASQYENLYSRVSA